MPVDRTAGAPILAAPARTAVAVAGTRCGPAPYPLSLRMSPMASASVPSASARLRRAASGAPNRAVSRAACAAVESLEDRRLLSVSLISVSTDGVTPRNANSGEASVSQDCRWVAFTSFAETFDQADGNRANDVYLRDMNGSAVQLVSVKAGGGGAGNMQSFDPTISADGNFVVFRSDATNLVANDTNQKRDTF